LRALEQQAAQAGRGIWRHSTTPRQSESPPANTQSPSISRVNLNRATAVEIEALPGLGPILATRIVRARPLRDFEALEAVRGIGPKKIGLLRPLVTFE
jgi:competence protein ComEA